VSFKKTKKKIEKKKLIFFFLKKNKNKMGVRGVAGTTFGVARGRPLDQGWLPGPKATPKFISGPPQRCHQPHVTPQTPIFFFSFSFFLFKKKKFYCFLVF
jgi:hypothetical protein